MGFRVVIENSNVLDDGGNAWAEKSIEKIRATAGVVSQQLQMNMAMRFQWDIHYFPGLLATRLLANSAGASLDINPVPEPLAPKEEGSFLCCWTRVNAPSLSAQTALSTWLSGVNLQKPMVGPDCDQSPHWRGAQRDLQATLQVCVQLSHQRFTEIAEIVEVGLRRTDPPICYTFFI